MVRLANPEVGHLAAALNFRSANLHIRSLWNVFPLNLATEWVERAKCGSGRPSGAPVSYFRSANLHIRVENSQLIAVGRANWSTGAEAGRQCGSGAIW